jgi:eukaryotic-like serine/threonine-protein kinase
MAHHLVRNAARRAGSLDELCDTLGRLIDRPEQRAEFLQAVLADQTPVPAPAATSAEEARRAEQELARYVGPIARILVKRALGTAGSADGLWEHLASHIPAEADRQAFLRRRG